MASELKEKTAKGLLWSAINNGAQQILVLAFGIVLGRILSPAEYGVVGMITIFTLIGTALQESGFRAALANMKEVRHEDYNAVFWCSLLIGCSTYLVLFFLSPFIADFFHEPVLTSLARYSFLSIPISSLGMVQGAYLFRHLQVKQQTIGTLTAHILSGLLGITLALHGFSYWGIVTQSLTYLIIITLSSWYFSPWRPTFDFNLAPVRPLFLFSSKLLITNIASQLNNNLLTVILGKYFSTQAVGNYNQANKWNTIGYQFIAGMLSSVTQPILASIRDDRERNTRVFLKMLSFTGFLSFPALFGLSAVTPELILITVGPKWEASIPLMQLLCIGGAFVPVNSLFSHLIVSQGKSDIYMRNIIAQVLLQLGVVLCLILTGGTIHQMVITYVCINAGWLIVWHHFSRRYIRLHAVDIHHALSPSFWGAIASVLPAFYLGKWLEWGLLPTFFLKIVVAGSIYLLLMAIFQRNLLNECLNYLLKKKLS